MSNQLYSAYHTNFTLPAFVSAGTILAIRPSAANGIRVVRMWVAPGIQAAQTGTFTVSVSRQAAGQPTGLTPIVPTPLSTNYSASTITGGTLRSTTIAAGSNGAALPQATINVASTAGFPSSGSVIIDISGSRQLVSYTGLTGTTFTGCTGGTGTLATNNGVTNTIGIAAGTVGVLSHQATPTNGAGALTYLLWQTSMMQPGWLWTPSSTSGINDEIMLPNGSAEALVIRLETAPTTASALWRAGIVYEEV